MWERLRYRIWCQPQNLLGWLFWRLLRQRQPGLRRFPYYCQTFRIEVPGRSWGLSLGRYLFCGTSQRTPAQVEALSLHEFGHSRQSWQLGPLYLLLVGIPSLAWAGLWRLGLFSGYSYFWFYTEAWAEAVKDPRRISRRRPGSCCH